MGRKHDTLVIGDTNLDQLTWDTPAQNVKKMVESTKIEIENIGLSTAHS